MAKSIYDKFSDFKIRHNLSNELICKIITEYANSKIDFARTYFTDKYKITEHVFYKARDYAVIFCLVDNEICSRLKNKSATNYSKNNDKNSAVASLAHFETLLVQRQGFLDSFSINEMQDIANKYVEGISTENIAKAYETGPFAIKYLLKKGIVMLIFDSSTVEQISIIVGNGLNKMLQIRKVNKEHLLNCIQAEISFLNSQIKCYDLYFRNCSNPPTLKSLREKLSIATKMYNETLQL